MSKASALRATASPCLDADQADGSPEARRARRQTTARAAVLHLGQMPNASMVARTNSEIGTAPRRVSR
jgi:hypothetical protein